MKALKFIGKFATVASLALIFTGCGNDSVDSATHATKSQKIELPPKGDTYEVIGFVKGLKKFMVKYDENFYRGGMPFHEKGMENLTKYGIRTIVSITPTDEMKAWAAKHGIEVIDLVFEKKDGLSQKLLDQYLGVLKNKKGPFYTHCHGGTHRASACAMAYRMYLQGWDYEKALKEYDALGGDPAKEKILVTSVKEPRK